MSALGPAQADRPRRQKVKLTEFGKAIMRCTKLGIRTMLPARILLYDPATQLAEVQLQHNLVLNDDDGEQELLPKPIPQCPVAWPSGTLGASYITFPLVPTDPGYLQISDRSLERWLTQGVPVDPGISQSHNVIDGVFHPQLRPKTQPITPPTSLSHMVLEAPLINLGVLAVSPAVKGTELVTALSTYSSALSAADATLAALAATWAGLPGAAQVAFALGFAPWTAAHAAATTALVTALAGTLSSKVFVNP